MSELLDTPTPAIATTTPSPATTPICVHSEKQPKIKNQGTPEMQPPRRLRKKRQVPRDGRGDRIRAFQFKKGQSGNPGGSKKGVERIKALLDHYAVMGCPAADMLEIRKRFPGVNHLTLQGAVMLKTYAAALDGDAWALNFLAERTEGKVPHRLSGELDGEATELLQRFADGLERADTNSETAPAGP